LCGGEGTGKSTQAKKLFEFFKSRNLPVVLTKEPGGTKIGMMIRKILLSPENSEISNKTELLLYLADRAEHFEKLILPSLQKGATVICDRFIDSTLVYQGMARQMDTEFIDYVHKYILGDFLPDLTLVLDSRPEYCLERIDSDLSKGLRTKDESRFDNEKISFHKKVRNGFLWLTKQDKTGRFNLINAEKSADEVFEEILSVIKSRKIIEN
jgi:dTMP kinase